MRILQPGWLQEEKLTMRCLADVVNALSVWLHTDTQ